MAYNARMKEAVQRAPKTLGNQLGRWAVHHNISVIFLSKVTGATRQTVYNWFSGGQVTPAYRNHVRDIIQVLTNAPTGEIAWKRLTDLYGQK